MQQGIHCLTKLDILVSRSGASKGARDWINNNLRDVASKYSHVRFKIVFSKDPYINPRITGHYVNGRVQHIVARNKTPEQMTMLVKRLHDRNGNLMNMKRWAAPKSATPSFQGNWAPEVTNSLPFAV